METYIQTRIEIAVHSRFWASYLYWDLPLEASYFCPCKWCKERRKEKK